MIDSHCHLTLISKNKSEIIKIVSRAKESGIKNIIDIGVHPSDIEPRIELLGNIENVYLTAGFYPDYAYSYTTDELSDFKQKIITLNKDKKNIYMLGEIGLDYYHNSDDTHKQIEFFETLIDMANELALPISIHCRDAFSDMLMVLAKNKVEHGGIMHCFSGGLEDAKKTLDLGFLISFSGVITYPKNQELRDVAKYVPNDSFCIETDAPYLSPQKVRGKKNEPSFLPYTANVVAKQKSMSEQVVFEHCYKNICKLLNI